MSDLSEEFIHLYVHTDYSMVDGLMDVKKVVKTAKSLGLPAVTITDFMNQCNLVKLCEETHGCGLKPIYAIELNVYDDTSFSNQRIEFFRMKLYAMNKVGYRNIVELQSDGWRQGSVKFQTCVKYSWLKKYSAGVIALSGGLQGEAGQLIVSGRPQQAKEKLKALADIYPNRFYVELSRCGLEGEHQYISQILPIAKELNLPIVATNPVMFAKKEDYEIHKIRVAIQAKAVLTDDKYVDPYTDEMYFKTPQEMKELFKDLPEAIANTSRIAQRCSVGMLLGKNFLPHIDTKGLSEAEFLRKEAYEGLEKRLRFLYPDPKIYMQKKPAYMQRLETELKVIIQMGFPGYFLIVMEFIQWSKANGVPVGPGRGSGGGSLVAYAITITDFDPLPFDLLFERFLNPERVSMPDFDVDFCTNNRERVIQHVKDLYGEQSVSQIITFGTLAAKASVKSVARVLGKSYSFGDRLAKAIPATPGMELSIALGRVPKKIDLASPDFIDIYEKDEECRDVIDKALCLEGLTTSHGKHAGGVVISPTVITDFAPLMCDEYGKDYKTQFDKHDVEEAGLVKFDFLGLKTLTIVDWALNMINARLKREGKPLCNISEIDLEDPESYKILQSTETTGVFQLESQGMRGLIQKMQPDRFEDMIALVALYRPGPLECGMVDNYVLRKHGKEEVAYPDPSLQHISLKPVLDPTYGIIVYQEQVMQIAQVLAGYTLGGADLLRRAMGKKQPEVMAAQKSVFREGAESLGVDGDLALGIFELVEKFAGYGFNKSHSAAYALVSFQTLWLKTHFPAEFLAAMMTGDKGNVDKVVSYINECHRLGIPVDPPDVNVGQVNFVVNEEGHVIFSLSAIKGIGDVHVENIIKERETNGPFKSMFDFCRRVDNKSASKKVMESLILSGAFDKIGGTHRAALMATLPEALKLGAQSTQDRETGTIDIFATAGFEEFLDPPLAKCAPYSDKEWLAYEAENLGLYLTGHPLDRYKKEITNFSQNDICNLSPTQHRYGHDEERPKVTIAGILVSLEDRITKKGSHFIRGTVLDYTGKIDFTLWNADYERYKDMLVKDMLLVVTGSVEFDSFNNCNTMRVSLIENIIQARLSKGRALRISLDEKFLGDEPFVDQLTTTFGKYSGMMPLEFVIRKSKGVVASMSQLRVEPADELIDELRYMTEKYAGQIAISYSED